MALVKYDLDTVHSHIDFSVRHLVVSKVKGRFKTWTGSLELDEENLTNSKVSVEIDVASVDTNEPQRDGHLRTGDFFEAEKHPKITFKSTSIAKKGESELAVTGDLTIKGHTHPVVLDVEFGGTVKDPWGKRRAGFTATTTIERKDFGLTFNQTLDHGGVAIGEKVTISLDIEATAAA